MRIRLAELQRMYKEKQKQLSKLQPKKEKEKESPQKDHKEKECGWVDTLLTPACPMKTLDKRIANICDNGTDMYLAFD